MKIESFTCIKDMNIFCEINKIKYIDLKIHNHIDYYEYNGLPCNQWVEYVLIYE